ncbi:NAD(P)/FAD-dependent oxidoreductase [Mycobacterium parmense]|uniref:Oxidoreductase n=1 Tax=Mycobacterium parmense TaxID=185642 RepID=A0A7I7YS54_9MYCO|nr:NAD(P)/FAD-dependent oxidoreductase [Mycobacterium parmense]MCV7353354.1 FAD-dependent oxidoreductase [Mycobacterium parmense]ORW54186.1 amine oxidase [Mycobacterium parmense]BBZ44087.1 oxidoreductase [Mycobacterium parmense]
MAAGPDVLVIGAGLAGLRCAGVLAAAGRDVRVWEAGDDVGGRVRTDEVDGFLCDRGFQVLNPAYPELERSVDVAALRLQTFRAGVAIRRQLGAALLVHPLREPALVPRMLASGAVRPREALALARWALPALRPAKLKSRRDDDTLRRSLDRCGAHGELRRTVDRFLAGVLLDDSGGTSNAFGLLLARMFLFGVPGLPAGGMRSLPRRLAEPLAGRISLNHKMTHFEHGGGRWTVHGPETTTARDVVVATGPVTAAALTGAPTPATHAVVTDWWAADEAPPGPPMLWVDSRSDPPGPVVNTAVISAAAPTYAPPGRHLISASALLGPDRAAPPETAMRRHAAEILGIDGGRWESVTRHVVEHALPAQPPPLAVRRPVHIRDGLWWCGDHRDTASIQGALVSGRRTAEALLRQRRP